MVSRYLVLIKKKNKKIGFDQIYDVIFEGISKHVMTLLFSVRAQLTTSETCEEINKLHVRRRRHSAFCNAEIYCHDYHYKITLLINDITYIII